MSEERKYSAQEMRTLAANFAADARAAAPVLMDIPNPEWVREEETVSAMLRQAADAEEELANLKTTSDELEKRALEYADHGVSSPLLTNTIKRLIAERNSLKARLEAVVKECENQIPACRGEDCKCNPTDSGYCDENCHDEIIVHTAVTAIIRVARGDGGAE